MAAMAAWLPPVAGPWGARADGAAARVSGRPGRRQHVPRGAPRSPGSRAAVAATAAAVVVSRGRRAPGRRAAVRLAAASGRSPEGAEPDPLAKDLQRFLEAQRRRPPSKDPLGGPLTPYSDNVFDLFFIAIFRFVMTQTARWQSPLAFWGEQAYDGMLEVAHAMQWKKSLQETEDASLKVIEDLIPDEGRERFRALLKPDKFGTELNAWITAAFFPFMVGKVQVEARTHEEMPRVPEGESWDCAVKIEKCRWLEKSGCVGMCVGLCKRPMQRMFGGVLGMPLSMEPNMEDLSCTMVFGKEPTAWEEDELKEQPCFASCATASSGSAACPKLA